MESDGHRSDFSGSASDVVQARDVYGGIHFHGSDHLSSAVPRQLPGDVAAFVNRQDELERLNALAAGVCVVVGTAGVGKTSLVLHWAHGVRKRYPDGQLFVNLRGYDPGPVLSPEQALDRFLRALGVHPGNLPVELDDRAALYRSVLADRRMLVILDNAATVGQVRPLLPGNADCLVLVTSRSNLSGLVARDGARRLTVGTLTEQTALELLSLVTADYRKHDDREELADLARLCARLPLALRIAAERASSRPMMRLSELIADLRDESGLWDALTADNDDEADAVRSVFAWSYRALPEPIARLFRLLGLHPGPDFSLPAVAALAGTPINQTRHQLDVLVGAHILEQHAPDRYQFHDLLRAYAIDQTGHHETADDRQAARERVITWYLRTATEAVASLDNIPGVFRYRDEALRWYESERANLVAATRVAAETGLHELAWQLPVALHRLFAEENPFEDWIISAQLGLTSARRVGDQRAEAKLLESLGKAHIQSHQLDQAEEFESASLTIRQLIGDQSGAATSINALGLLAWRRHRLAEAQAHFENAIDLFRQLGDQRGEAIARCNLGMTYNDLDRPDEAVAVLHESAATLGEIGNRAHEADALHFLAAALRKLGKPDEALTSIQAALAIAREDSRQAWGAFWQLELARIQRALGQAAVALESYREAAAVHSRLGDRSREAVALDGTGEVLRDLGRPEEAIPFHLLAASAHRELNDRWKLAAALVNLAAACHEAGRPEQARPHQAEATEILMNFDDPRAIRLRERLDGLEDRGQSGTCCPAQC